MRVVTGLPLDDWRAAGPAARAAEQVGFDGVSSAEIAHDPFAPLVAATLATERVELSTGIVVAFPRSPMVVANSAWDLQAQSGGRFSLGLGSQVKGHNERRFGLAWSAPVPRLREYVGALRAIWRCWERGEKLAFEGEHYRFTLMTPEFSPAPTGLPPVPISIAAVGPAMLRLAGEVCDGARLHGFCTRRYLEEVCLPRIEEGLARSGRARSSFEISGGGFIATGRREQDVQKAVDEVRYRVAFYGSTRTYAPVFDLHGLGDLGAALHRKSVEGKWEEMAAEISDDVVRLFATVGTWDQLPAAIEKRFGGLTDVTGLSFPADTPREVQTQLIRDLRRIDSPFTGHATSF
jgi:probable F420-dependent oxidoreductase